MKVWRFLLLFFSVMLFSTSVLSNEIQCENIEIPIVFDQYGLPTIEIFINNQSKFALLDLGSTAGIHLPTSDVNRMANAKYTGEVSKSSNISGEVFSSREFSIPFLKIGCMKFENIVGYELTPWASSIGEQKEESSSEQQIVVGQGFFADKRVIINYVEKTIKISSGAEAFTSEGNQFFPYSLTDEGITLRMNSSVADYQMVLDTGSSSSIFSMNKVNAKELLVDCEYNIGPDLKCKLFASKVKCFGSQFYPKNIALSYR